MKKQKMSTIDKVLLGLVGFLLGFIIAMIVIYGMYYRGDYIVCDMVAKA